MLEDHYTKRVTISRMVVTGNKKAPEVVVSDVPCHIQPMSAAYQNGQWGRLGKEYRLFTGTEVLIGDKLEDNDGNTYDVFGVQAFDFRIGQRHYEALIRGV